MFARLFVARRSASVVNRSLSTHRLFSSTSSNDNKKPPSPSSSPSSSSTTKPPPSEASKSLSLALRAWRVTRDKSAATRHFDDAQRQASTSPEPDIAALAYGHGAMFAIYVQEDFEAATALLTEAVRVLKLQQVSTRTRFTVHWQVAQFAHNFQSDWTAAEMHYKAALAIDDTNPELHVAYARMFIDRGGGRSDYATANRMLAQITRRWPDCAPALNWLGFIADQVDRNPNEAHVYYERAYKAAPKNLELLQNYADFLRESRNDRHRADELVAQFDKIAQQQNPTRSDEAPE